MEGRQKGMCESLPSSSQTFYSPPPLFLGRRDRGLEVFATHSGPNPPQSPPLSPPTVFVFALLLSGDPID